MSDLGVRPVNELYDPSDFYEFIKWFFQTYTVLPTRETIASHFDCSAATVRRKMAVLEANGLIHQDRNTYTVKSAIVTFTDGDPAHAG